MSGRMRVHPDAGDEMLAEMDRLRLPCLQCLAQVENWLQERYTAGFRADPGLRADIERMRSVVGWPRTIRHYCRQVVRDAGPPRIECPTYWPCPDHQPADGRQ